MGGTLSLPLLRVAGCPWSLVPLSHFSFSPVVRRPSPGFVGALWEPCRRIRVALGTHWGRIGVAL